MRPLRFGDDLLTPVIAIVGLLIQAASLCILGRAICAGDDNLVELPDQ